MSWGGREIGPYRLSEAIGQSRYSEVYRAYEEGRDRWVALKVIDTTRVPDPSFRMRFQREARMASKLRHPHIVPVYDYGEREGLVYLAMDYVEGGTLDSRLNGQPMVWPEVAALILPIARALAYAHGQGAPHHDVKPSNILLARADWPLLSDFGMMRVFRGASRPPTVSESGDMPFYESPEQAQAIGVDIRSDIYSLGVVMYEAVAGRRPFSADTPMDVAMLHINRIPESPSVLNPSLPAMAEAIIVRAMAKNPGGRYQSMEDMVNALQVAMMQTASGSVDPTYTPIVARHGTCSRCGAVVNLLGRYCAKCGATLRPGDLTPPSPATANAPATRASGYRFALESGSEIVFPPKTELIIGRADKVNQEFPDIDLQPHNGVARGVSRLHARLHRRGNAWAVEDAGSSNGTFLNGRRVAAGEEVLLREGDRLRCGQLVLTFRAT